MREIFADSFDTIENSIESDDYYMDGYKELAFAVVERAIKNYKRALKRLCRNPNDYEAKVEKESCERFFRQDMGIYSDLADDVPIRGVRERVNAEMGR